MQQATKDTLGAIIQEGLSGQCCLIGFPHDIGAKRSGLRQGQDHGPDCLRRFLPLVGPLHNVERNLEIKQQFSDYGNIEVEKGTLEELLTKLQQKVEIVRAKGNTPIIIGGTHDQQHACLQSTSRIINILPRIDSDTPYDGDKISSTCTLNHSIPVTYFATDSRRNQTDKKYQCVDIMKIRRRPKLQGDTYTQAGQAFQELLSSLNEEKIHLSFSLEAIDSAFCPGVSTPSSIGLTAEETIEIMLLSGQHRQIVSVDISDYNPTIEDYRTGFLLANMIYYFLLGRCG